VPARAERAGFGLPVSHHGKGDQVRVVEHRPVGVRNGVAQLTFLVDAAGSFGGAVAADATREGELLGAAARPGPRSCPGKSRYRSPRDRPAPERPAHRARWRQVGRLGSRLDWRRGDEGLVGVMPKAIALIAGSSLGPDAFSALVRLSIMPGPRSPANPCKFIDVAEKEAVRLTLATAILSKIQAGTRRALLARSGSRNTTNRTGRNSPLT